MAEQVKTEIDGPLEVRDTSQIPEEPPTQEAARMSESINNGNPLTFVASTSSSPPKAPVSGSPTQIVPNFPPPKTDKPRPHVCATCTRSFARLEHLKRHERSHTKEKPFECQSCTRCFARRDLLLRHQQKLHSTTTPSSRPRNGRRESAAGVANARVRKNSMAATPNQNMRPRANTLSHVDSSTLGMMSAPAFSRPFVPMHSHHNSLSAVPTMGGYGMRGMNLSSQASALGLRLDTSSIPQGLSSGLRTAPPYGGFPSDFDMEIMGYDTSNSNTINPHELHTPSLHGLGIEGPTEFMNSHYSNMVNAQAIIDDDGGFDWMTHGFEQQMTFMPGTENAIESSPSAMDTNSPATFQDNAVLRQGSQSIQGHRNDGTWQPPLVNHQHGVSSPMSMDINALFSDMSAPQEQTISPKSLLAQNTPGFDMYFTTPPDMSSIDTSNLAAISHGTFTLPFKHENVPSTSSTASLDSSMRQSSIAPNLGDLVTEQSRASVIANLSRFASFGQRRQSAPVISSPLTPGGSNKIKGFNANVFPTTQELQRYVAAYFRYCHPHLPFLHLATLNFESAEYSPQFKANATYSQHGKSSNAIGGSCLLLSIAAMGALYENEHNVSKDLFEYSKRTISNYLEGRRNSHTNRTMFAAHNNDGEETPLWLVQAMLLNVIYGHNCGDKTAADIASNHCAALVSLARGAELAKPYIPFVNTDAWTHSGQDSAEVEWLEWKTSEERKRTLYAIFVLSSMLVMAYNRPPALTNSEIRLDLPCDEELWAAESSQAWRTLGGMLAVRNRTFPFAGALTHLLTAAQREKQANEERASSNGWSQSEPSTFVLKPSSFGCLVLIDALHNYIWETRQRHLGRQWTHQEVEAMHAHVEPALRAWSTAWSSNPLHVIERPNPFGAGPLPADSIPLLDLAYVRLFVDFGRSKEAYWQRDYDTMAQELAKGPETGYGGNADRSGGAIPPTPQSLQDDLHTAGQSMDTSSVGTPQSTHSQASRRERHLRKAAFYAADHLVNADRFGGVFVEKLSRDLPMQSILCACDCAQVLSEWVTTLQERVGCHVGIIGKDPIEFRELPAVLMLDDEDRTLLDRIQELLVNGEQRSDNPAALRRARFGGFASSILVLTSQAMARAAIWPGKQSVVPCDFHLLTGVIVTKLMAQSLEIQARHVTNRAQASVSRGQGSPAR